MDVIETRLPEVKLICREDRPDRLLAELALHHFDMLLLDSPLDAGLPIRGTVTRWPSGRSPSSAPPI